MSLSDIDLFSSLAELALLNIYSCPKISKESKISLNNSRHPVVEQLLPMDEDFIPNSIELDNNVLVISSETSNNVSDENLRLNEFNYSSFQRSFKVPESVNLDKIKGTYKNGILKILLPKKKDSISKSNRVITIG